MSTPKLPCDLCQQPVKIQGFSLKSITGVKVFCCEGCKSIYQLLNPAQFSNPQPL